MFCGVEFPFLLIFNVSWSIASIKNIQSAILISGQQYPCLGVGDLKNSSGEFLN